MVTAFTIIVMTLQKLFFCDYLEDSIDGQGLKTYRKFFHAQIIRPLLNFNKKDCLNYVKNKLKFIEDDSNNNNSFDRNFLRNIIFPEIIVGNNLVKEFLL